LKKFYSSNKQTIIKDCIPINVMTTTMPIYMSIRIKNNTYTVVVTNNEDEENNCIVVNEKNELVELKATDPEDDEPRSVHPFVFTGSNGGVKGKVYFKDEDDFIYNAKLNKIIGRYVQGGGRSKGGRGLGKGPHVPYIVRKCDFGS
jgi:hypothetical protein